MARARKGGGRRAVATDERRFPNFEGIGPNLTGQPQASVEPGARRGNVGTGAFEFPLTRAGQSRLQGLQASAFGQQRASRGGGGGGGGAPGMPSAAAPSAGGGSSRTDRVQGPGALPPGRRASERGKAPRRGRSVRG